MIGYRLCRNKTARHPFYLESISTNLYTVEELCYFLYHNPFLIDDSVLNSSLTRWMAEELDMPETALLMERAMKERGSLADCILPLFQKTQYLSAGELSRYRKTLDTLGSVSPSERLKRKGDALAQNGKYTEAIRIYHEALSDFQEEGNRQWNQSFRAVVWYNTGVVKMQLFDYEEGTDAFLRAWKLNPEEPYALAYLEALRLTLPDEKYKTAAKEFLDGAAAEVTNRDSAEKNKTISDAWKETENTREEILQRVDAVIAAAREKADIRIQTELSSDSEKMLQSHPEKVVERIAAEYHTSLGT